MDEKKKQASGPVKWILIGISVIFLFVMLVLPLVVVVTQALSRGWECYVQAVTDEYTLKALALTIEATVAAVVCNTIFGLCAAWAMTRFHFRGKKLLTTLIDIPVTVSPVIAGLIYILVFGKQSPLYSVLDKAGIQIVPATGRGVGGIPPMIRELPGANYAITTNGAVVADLKNNKAIKTCGLSNEMIQRILNIAKKYHSATDPFIDGRAITEPASIDHMDEFGLSPEMQKLIRDTREVVPNVMEYVKTTGAEAEKVNIFMADLEEREVLRKELMAIPELSISSSMYNNLEVNAKGADKGSALLWLADYLGIDREETMSFGDGENDIPMIQAAGIGVAMENALDTVKAAADMITLKNDEDGVAAAIRKIIFGSNEK